MKPATPGPVEWAVVIPVKRLDRAKTRLREQPPTFRAALMRALARDVVGAVLDSAQVVATVVVTSDAQVREDARSAGATVVDDPGPDLNAAVRAGESFAGDRWPRAGLAAVVADLPLVGTQAVDAALGAALAVGRAAGRRRFRAVVPDATGVGSTVLCAVGMPLLPAFGPDSFARHVDGGALPVDAVGLEGLRFDLDSEDDLRRVRDTDLSVIATATRTVLSHGSFAPSHH